MELVFQDLFFSQSPRSSLGFAAKDQTDSGIFDNFLEVLAISGGTWKTAEILPHLAMRKSGCVYLDLLDM